MTTKSARVKHGIFFSPPFLKTPIRDDRLDRLVEVSVCLFDFFLI